MTNYWKNLFALLVVSLAADWLIASTLTSNRDDAWSVFLLLVFAPVFFVAKAAVVKVLIWFLIARRTSVDDTYRELTSSDWPRPDDHDTNNPDDYLTQVAANERVSVETRLKAANLIGINTAMNASAQVIARIFWMTSFKAALKRLQVARL